MPQLDGFEKNYNLTTFVETPPGPDGCHEVETSPGCETTSPTFLKDSLQANCIVVSM